MTTQPIADRIGDLRAWLRLPPEMRDDAAGALATLDEIAGSHASLLEACKAALEKFCEYYPARTGAMPEAVQKLERAIALAESP